MSNMNKNERRLTGYRNDDDYVSEMQHQSYYDTDIDHYNPNLSLSVDDDDIYEDYGTDFHDIDHGAEEEEVEAESEEEQEDEEVGEEDDDDSGSELSIPDPNIDFAMVYALHTFTATVEGQATAVRGEPLTLLDDSNSYWWLVKVLNTSVVGYIPAENIETPYERLARLNSHRNVELTRRDIQDAFPVSAPTKPKQTKRVTLAKGVQFQSQIIYGSSDDEGGDDDDDSDDDFHTEYEQWNERMNSDDSETDDQDSDDDDPYQFYAGDEEQQTLDMYSSSPTHMTIDDYTTRDSLNPMSDEEPIDYLHTQDLSDQSVENDNPKNRDSFKLNDETIKISLTPSIARDDGHKRGSDSSDTTIQAKLKKAAEFEKLLGDSPEPRSSSKDKKEKFGIRKLFSRSKGNKSSDSLDRRSSNGSLYNDTGSITSSVHERNSLDSTVQPTYIKVYAGNSTEFGHDVSYKEATVYPSTTAIELIHQLVQLDQQQQQIQQNDDDRLLDDNAYHDYYLIVKTSAGEDYTLVPSDKPLEIFHSLNAHRSTPMPSLKKARRISQLMGSENTMIGGPLERVPSSDDQIVRFYLFSKTKRVDEGDIHIKVSLFSLSEDVLSRRVDKLVKIPSTVLVKDAVTLLLEKFHILNGISGDGPVESLRLDGHDDIVKYGLTMCHEGQQHMLDLDTKLIDTFQDPPHIHYRRNSHPDRNSITVTIPPPDKDELYFILRPLEMMRPNRDHDHSKTRRLVRHNTPMPRSSSHAKYTPASHTNTSNPSLSDSTEDTYHDTPITPPPPPPPPATPPSTQRRSRPESTDSAFFCEDFGMNELMVIIRGAAAHTKPRHTTSYTIRNEISDVFKESHTRLDQLEKELDRIMSEAVKVHPL